MRPRSPGPSTGGRRRARAARTLPMALAEEYPNVARMLAASAALDADARVRPGHAGHGRGSARPARRRTLAPAATATAAGATAAGDAEVSEMTRTVRRVAAVVASFAAALRPGGSRSPAAVEPGQAQAVPRRPQASTVAPQHLGEAPRRHQRREAGDVHQGQGRPEPRAPLPARRAGHARVLPRPHAPDRPRRRLHRVLVGAARRRALLQRRHPAGVDDRRSS